MLRRLFLLLILTATVRAQISPGATREETIGILGPPKSTLFSGNKEILNYADSTVRLENGVVITFEIIPPGGKRPTMILTQVGNLPDPDAEAVPEESMRAGLIPPPDPIPPAPLPAAIPNSPTSAPSQIAPPAANVVPAPLPLPQPPLAPAVAAIPKVKVQKPIPAPLPVASNPSPSLVDGLLLHDATRVLAGPLRTAGIVLLALVLGYGLIEFVLSCFRFRSRYGVTLWEQIPGTTVAEPLLMRASTPPFPPRRPESLRDWTLDRVRKIEWHNFGRVVTEYYRILGYRAELTGAGSAGSIDVQVYRPEENRPYLLVQCKALGERKVDARLVQEFHRAMEAAEAESAAFFATGEFTEEARIFNHGKEYDLVGGEDFLTRISHLPPSRQATLWQKAIEQDEVTTSPSTVGMNLMPAS
jgi:hypothetical protein